MVEQEYCPYELYYDVEHNQPVKDFLIFPTIDAGSVKELTLHIQNKLDTDLGLDMSLIGKSVSIIRYPHSLKAKEQGVITMKASPKLLSRPEPIDVKLDIKTEFVM